MNETDVKGAATSAAAGLLAGVADAKARAEMLTEVMSVQDGRPYRVDINGAPVTMEGWLPAPVSVRADVELHDAASFGGYVNRFKNPSTIVFADERSSRFTAVIDYHEINALTLTPRWGRNRAFLQLKHTDEWNEWQGIDGEAKSQADFAQFLEDHIPDIAEPAGAQLVEIARTLEANTTGRFSSAIRANDGSIAFNYVKDVQATAKDGTIKIPTEVKLMLQPYEHTPDRYPVIGKLRYRITSGQLTLWFDLFGVNEAIEQAFGDVRTAIAGMVKETVVLAGPAPKAQTAE